MRDYSEKRIKVEYNGFSTTEAFGDRLFDGIPVDENHLHESYNDLVNCLESRLYRIGSLQGEVLSA